MLREWKNTIDELITGARGTKCAKSCVVAVCRSSREYPGSRCRCLENPGQSDLPRSSQTKSAVRKRAAVKIKVTSLKKQNKNSRISDRTEKMSMSANNPMLRTRKVFLFVTIISLFTGQYTCKRTPAENKFYFIWINLLDQNPFIF